MPIKAVQLGHQFPGAGPLFTGIDFTVSAGDVMAVTGPSGSGKTTLLSILARQSRATHGTIEYPGVHTVRLVTQNPHGTARRTALDHVVLPLLAAGRRRADGEAEADQILADFGLTAVRNRPFRALSGGEAQRLMLARALAGHPDLILVDEPTAQLDAVSSASVIAHLSALAGQGTIVVIATHDPAVARVCTTHLDLAAR